MTEMWRFPLCAPLAIECSEANACLFGHLVGEREAACLEYGSLPFLNKIRLVCLPAAKPAGNLLR